MIITTDDLCLEYLDNFKLFDDIKKDFPKFKLTAFSISNFKNKESLAYSKRFEKWYDKRKDWVEIAVHSYDHQYPPDGDRKDQEKWIRKALGGLRQYLPEKYGYRSPGWQTTSKTIPILKRLNFNYMAYETSVVDINSGKILHNRVINSHLYDVNSIMKIRQTMKGGEKI